MPRNVINRSISFDPELFERMEGRRAKLLMDRSEYVKRCVLRDMQSGGDMVLQEVSPAFAQGAISTQSRSGKRKAKK